MKLSRVFLLVFLLTSLALGQEQTRHSAWSELPRPGGESNKGLFLDPSLLNMGSRFHLVWSGTNQDIRHPEVFHSSLDGGDKAWKDPRAPFFGQNKGRVRKLALGKTRNLVGLLFQRTLTQGNDAYEVLLSISSDDGWSWSTTIEIDSYVADKTGGTAVAIAGRQGRNRPEFALAWTRAFGDVRTANFDISSSLRPEGSQVGSHSEGAEKLGVGALGSAGFTIVFNNGAGLTAGYIKALIGKVEDGSSLLRGRFGRFFDVASRPYGPSRLVVGSDGTMESMTSDGKDWNKDDDTLTLPFSTTGVTAECDMDDNKNLHVMMVRPVQGAFEIWYAGQKDRKWMEPEFVDSLDDKMDLRGFDIAASNNYVVIVVSQGFSGKFLRRKLD